MSHASISLARYEIVYMIIKYSILSFRENKSRIAEFRVVFQSQEFIDKAEATMRG